MPSVNSKGNKLSLLGRNAPITIPWEVAPPRSHTYPDLHSTAHWGQVDTQLYMPYKNRYVPLLITPSPQMPHTQPVS